MHEILQSLHAGQRLLDLGSGSGSFDADAGSFIAVRADLDRPVLAAANFVQTDAACLPFADRAFDGVISNHSLEHFEDLSGALAEIGRVLKPSGALYIAVPDASTFCDRLYRWLARGGGRSLRPPSSPPGSSAPRDSRTSPRARSSPRFPISTARTAALPHPSVCCSRAAAPQIYGWALYFGHSSAPIETEVWSNVCARCGSGAPSATLATHRLGFLRTYACSRCGTVNLFSEDRHYQR